MNKLRNEVQDAAVEMQMWASANNVGELTFFEALTIAVKMQHNRVLSDAFMLGNTTPSALEAIAMELGASRDGSSIKDAIYSLSSD